MKRNAHDALVERAREAIEDVTGDTTVPPAQTIESLEELLNLIDTSLAALQDDDDDLGAFDDFAEDREDIDRPY